MPWRRKRLPKKKKEIRYYILDQPVKTAIIRGISIDVGIKNLAIYVEEFDRKELQALSSRINRSSIIGPPDVLQEVYKNGRMVFHEKVDISAGSAKFTTEAMLNAIRYLNGHRKIFDSCFFLCIEDQLKENPMARRIQQHILTWFSFIYGNSKILVPFPATRKTQVLGAPKKARGVKAAERKKEIKEWSTIKAQEIFELRGDNTGLFNLLRYTKKDDMADSMVQLQAFKYQIFIRGTI